MGGATFGREVLHGDGVLERRGRRARRLRYGAGWVLDRPAARVLGRCHAAGRIIGLVVWVVSFDGRQDVPISSVSVRTVFGPAVTDSSSQPAAAIVSRPWRT